MTDTLKSLSYVFRIRLFSILLPFNLSKLKSCLTQCPLFYTRSSTEGMWKYNFYIESSELFSKEDLLWENSINMIVAYSENDILIVSNWGMVHHFNGANWKENEEIASIITNDGSFLTGNVSYNGKHIYIVGKSNNLDGIVIKADKQHLKNNGL